MILRRPPQIRVREKQRGLAILLEAAIRQRRIAILGRARAHDTVAREQQVEDERAIEPPVARVVVHEHGRDAQAPLRMLRVDGRGKGACDAGVVGREHGREGPDGGVGGHDVGGRDDVLEAVCVGDGPALVAVAAADEHGAGFVVRHVGEGRVGLHEHARGEGDVEFLAQLGDPLGFVFAAAVGEQDEGDSRALEEGEGVVGAGDGVG